MYEQVKGLKELPMDEPLSPGHRLCPGCGASLVVRQVLLAAPKDTIVANATGCLEVSTALYPYSAWNRPWIHSAFENAPAVASGIEAGFKALTKRGEAEEHPIVVFGGDGGTYDIGFQALSGAIERGQRFLYVCYDNEAYMNTGIQRSGGTPRGSVDDHHPGGFRPSREDGGQEGHNVHSGGPSRPLCRHSLDFSLAGLDEQGEEGTFEGRTDFHASYGALHDGAGGSTRPRPSRCPSWRSRPGSSRCMRSRMGSTR